MIHCISNNKEEREADVAHHSGSDQTGLRYSKGPPTCSFLPPIHNMAKRKMQAQDKFSFFFSHLTMCNLSHGQHTVKRAAIVEERKQTYGRFIAASRLLCISVYLCYCLMTTIHTHRGGEEKQILLIMWCPGMSLCKRGCQLTYHMWDKPYYC